MYMHIYVCDYVFVSIFVSFHYDPLVILMTVFTVLPSLLEGNLGSLNAQLDACADSGDVRGAERAGKPMLRGVEYITKR